MMVTGIAALCKHPRGSEGEISQVLLAEHDNGQIRVQVGIVIDALACFGVERDMLVDANAVILAELIEVGDREEADILGVIPPRAAYT